MYLLWIFIWVENGNNYKKKKKSKIEWWIETGKPILVDKTKLEHRSEKPRQMILSRFSLGVVARIQPGNGINDSGQQQRSNGFLWSHTENG